MMTVMLSLGYMWVGRKRFRCPLVSKSCCQVGANCCQKSSTEQNSSSILITEPPGDKHWVSSLLYLTRNVPYPELTLFKERSSRHRYTRMNLVRNRLEELMMV